VLQNRQAQEKAVVDNIRARGSRPSENGTSSQSAFIVKDDVSKLSKEDRRNIAKRVMMGEKITIDCATMVNKGFEVIEAMHFFNCSIDKVDVVVHPQSVVHSMVEFEDGVVISQMGIPKMEIPIQLALTYPERLETSVEKLSFSNRTLNFYDVDNNRYPCFGLVKTAMVKGGIYPCAISSADEEVVRLFLEGKILFTEIFDYLKYVLDNIDSMPLTFENLKVVDRRAKGLVLKRYKENV